MATLTPEDMTNISKMALEQATTAIARQASVFAQVMREEEESGNAMPASVALKAFANAIIATNKKVWPKEEGKPS